MVQRRKVFGGECVFGWLALGDGRIGRTLTWNIRPGDGVRRRTCTYDRMSRRWPSRLAAKQSLLDSEIDNRLHNGRF